MLRGKRRRRKKKQEKTTQESVFLVRIAARCAPPFQETTPPDTVILTKDGRGVDGGGGADAAVGRGAQLQVAVDASDGEREPSASGARDGLLLVARGPLAGAERALAEFWRRRRGGKGVNGEGKGAVFVVFCLLFIVLCCSFSFFQSFFLFLFHFAGRARPPTLAPLPERPLPARPLAPLPDMMCFWR